MNRLGIIKTGYKDGKKLINTPHFIVPEEIQKFTGEEKPTSLLLVFSEDWDKDFIYSRARRKYSKSHKTICIGYNHWYLSQEKLSNDQLLKLQKFFGKYDSVQDFDRQLEDFDDKQKEFLLSRLVNCRGVNFDSKKWEDKMCDESCNYRNSCKENLLLNFNLRNKEGELFDRYFLDYFQLQTPSVITMNNTEKTIDRIFKIDGHMGDVTLELFKTKKTNQDGFPINVVDVRIVR